MARSSGTANPNNAAYDASATWLNAHVADYVSQSDAAAQTLSSDVTGAAAKILSYPTLKCDTLAEKTPGSGITFSNTQFTPSFTIWKSGATYYAMANTGAVTSNAAFATLVNASITTANAAGGGVIYLKAGTYSQLAALVQKPYVAIVGERGATIELDAAVDCITSAANAAGNFHMEVHNLYVDLNGRNQNAVDWLDPIVCKVHNCRFYDSIGDYIVTAASAGDSYFNEICFNYFMNPAGHDSGAAINTAKDSLIMGNQTGGSGANHYDYGVYLNGSGCRVVGNHFAQCNYGAYVPTSGTVITGNHFDFSYLRGVYVGTGDNTTITGNLFAACGYSAGQYALATENNADNVTISGNIFGISGGFPDQGQIVINANHPATIQGNTFDNVGGTVALTVNGGVTARINVQGNSGLTVENSGTSTGTGAQQTIAHGLDYTPNRVWLTDIENGANPYQSAAADGTNIYVLAVLNQDYAWRAEKVWV